MIAFYERIGYSADPVVSLGKRLGGGRPMTGASTLVMFDIDGTLTLTDGIDGECYVQALADVFGFEGIDADWSNYTHTTDSGILAELCHSRIGRSPSDHEATGFKTRFVELLADAAGKCSFDPVAGAPKFLANLVAKAEFRVSLATGAWRDSARLKMASAGLCFDDYPSATADDAVERAAIMEISLQRAVALNKRNFASVVYVGDGVWDARACRALGMPFIGIGADDQAERLRGEGAVVTFPDLSDSDAFVGMLNSLSHFRG